MNNYFNYEMNNRKMNNLKINKQKYFEKYSSSMSSIVKYTFNVYSHVGKSSDIVIVEKYVQKIHTNLSNKYQHLIFNTIKTNKQIKNTSQVL
jgi:hypothetical protein